MKDQFQFLQSDTVDATLGIRPAMCWCRSATTTRWLTSAGCGAYRHARTGRGRHDRPHQPVRDRRVRTFHRADSATTSRHCHARGFRRREFRQEDIPPGGPGSRPLVGRRPRPPTTSISAVVAGLSSKMTSAEQAFGLGSAWKPYLNLTPVCTTDVKPDGAVDTFRIGPHTPTMKNEDVVLLHRLCEYHSGTGLETYTTTTFLPRR